MKTLFILLLISGSSFFALAQSCSPASCDKKSCGPGGTKKEEAAIITSMRNDLQTIILKMSKSSLPFDKQVVEMKIEKGGTDDESLLFISRAATNLRYHLLSQIETSKLVTSLRNYKPENFASKQQMVAALKKEIQILNSQAEKL
jgi:hypothetical protein